MTNVSITFAYRNVKCQARAIPTLNADVRIVNGDNLTVRGVHFRANYNGHEHGEESTRGVRICSDIGRFVYNWFGRIDTMEEMDNVEDYPLLKCTAPSEGRHYLQ